MYVRWTCTFPHLLFGSSCASQPCCILGNALWLVPIPQEYVSQTELTMKDLREQAATAEEVQSHMSI